MKIALVDDNAVNRSNFLQKVASFPELKISLEAVDGNDFLAKMETLSVDLLPHVVFMDIQMPNLNGIETIKQAKAIYHSIHFIVLTVFEDDDAIFEAIQAGASGYLLKHESNLSIRDALQEVYDFGGMPMSPAIARKALKTLGQKANNKVTPNISPGESSLTPPEFEVLQHIVNGYDAKRIAAITGFSTLTVRKQLADVYTKLHVDSKAQGAIYH